MAERIRFEQVGRVGSILVEAPPLNLFGEGMGEELVSALDAAEGAGLRALIIRAEGKVFTGGVDVQLFEGLSAADAESLAHDLLAITRRVEDLPFPTISSVAGLCLTWGFELSLACDLIWAADSARFGLVERVVGITPFMGGVQRVAERAGPARGRELVMTGELYASETLRQWGVVNRVVALAEARRPDPGFGRGPGRRAYEGDVRHQAHRPRAGGRGDQRSRRPHPGDRRRVVRDRRHEAGDSHFPRGRPRQGHVRGQMTLPLDGQPC